MDGVQLSNNHVMLGKRPKSKSRSIGYASPSPSLATSLNHRWRSISRWLSIDIQPDHYKPSPSAYRRIPYLARISIMRAGTTFASGWRLPISFSLGRIPHNINNHPYQDLLSGDNKLGSKIFFFSIDPAEASKREAFHYVMLQVDLGWNILLWICNYRRWAFLFPSIN